MLLAEVVERPLHARAAKDNLASIRVLEKCGFVISGYDHGFADARGEEIEEVVMILVKFIRSSFYFISFQFSPFTRWQFLTSIDGHFQPVLPGG